MPEWWWPFLQPAELIVSLSIVTLQIPRHNHEINFQISHGWYCTMWTYWWLADDFPISKGFSNYKHSFLQPQNGIIWTIRERYCPKSNVLQRICQASTWQINHQLFDLRLMQSYFACSWSQGSRQQHLEYWMDTRGSSGEQTWCEWESIIWGSRKPRWRGEEQLSGRGSILG